MSSSNDVLSGLDVAAVLEANVSGILIFNSADDLIFDNEAARTVLGSNLALIRSDGWSAMVMLIEASTSTLPNKLSPNEIRAKAQRRPEPVRFHMLINGAYTPCWASAVPDDKDKHFVAITIDRPDWSAVTELMSTFRSEARSAITSTSGHADFIRRILKNPPPNSSVEDLAKRTLGMVDLISTDMYELKVLMELLHRLEIIRIGELPEIIAQSRKRISATDFIEDFVEELYEKALFDPKIDAETYRERLILDVDDGLYVEAPEAYLENILSDLLRNAFMYSEPETPITIRVVMDSQKRNVEFDIKDEGCGVRDKEVERVFRPFERARQPHVMRESGYGISLYLAKAEIDAMGGRIWFDSEEGVGSTFSFKLPVAE